MLSRDAGPAAVALRNPAMPSEQAFLAPDPASVAYRPSCRFPIGVPQTITRHHFPPCHSLTLSTTMPLKREIASLAAAAAAPPPPPRRRKLQTTLGLAAGTRNIAPATPAPAPVPVSHYGQDIVDRKYYPPVLSDARCAAYSSGDLAKPIDELSAALSATAGFRSRLQSGQSVVHWFRTDLRPQDNTALHLAVSAAAAASGDCSVIGLYVFSPQDFEAHVVSPARLDFILQSLQILRQDLAKLAIPLHVEAVEPRHRIPATVVRLAKQWAATHVFANMEYEVDELRRDAMVVRLGESNGVAVNVVHDACVVPPGTLLTKVFFSSFFFPSFFFPPFLFLSFSFFFFFCFTFLFFPFLPFFLYP